MKPLGLALILLAAGCPGAKVDVGYAAPPPDGTTVTCPVSREQCVKSPLTPAAVFEMKTYYFCCDDCPKRFRAQPGAYTPAK